VYDKALASVLATNDALITMAQLVDGLPLLEVARSAKGCWHITPTHPLEEHRTLCDGALEKAKAYRDTFNSSIITLPTQVRITR
jgi:hypothetical protein